MTSPTRALLERSVPSARELGRLFDLIREFDARITTPNAVRAAQKIGPHELMCMLRTIPSARMPINRVAPGVTQGACRDAHETVVGLIEHMALDSTQDEDTRILMKAARILNRKANAE